LHYVLELLVFPVYVIGPVDILRLPGPIAVHDLLVNALVLGFQLVEVKAAPVDVDELAELVVGLENVQHVVAGVAQSSYDLLALTDGPLDLSAGVDHHLVDGLTD
jgi:hypothetical protein